MTTQQKIIKKDEVIKVVTYIDGDPYSSSYIKVDQFNSASGANTPNNYYLHRDYQGSIVALSNTSGRVVEKRYFDAWGNIKQVVHTSWNGTVATNTTNKTLGILDRGYTGHEHLQSVGLIHMNGRLYDPLIRRFLSPDNFVQDPYNTQNFDRYTYVYNNPLIYNDPSGEWIQIVIGAAIAIASNMIMNAIQGIPIWYGIGKAATIGAVSGAVSFGIGTAATQITAGVAKASFQVVAHGLSGAIMSEIDGGNGISGMLSGMISSAISSAVQGLTSTTFYADEDYTQLATVTKDKALSDVLTVAAGTLSGGISASVSGGNFWQGIRQGAITSGLNHIANHTKNLIADKKFKNDLIAELKENGIITDATPEFNKSSIIELLSKSTTLGNLWEKSGYIGFKLSSIEKGLNGEVDETAKKSSLTGKYTSITANKVILYKTAFQSFGKLAYVIGHELIHVYHIKIGFTLNILNSMEPISAKKYLEINAYKWNLAYGDPEAHKKINYYQK
ncbi:RHS repeat-associated core domain-containing protein [Empedobacter brevis]|uniref:RHS repeat-associated core domain-containing protein n=1 Tax=Empedobacter brevis TaxID=247 RepID=A0AAJ1QDZ7_9FLAO|nr:RHS repeat-associated core domain-containing protein [Empedobacter brevis]MDM1072286.1 RHS repeat-associated core domain-containing protein [Empedobacter brevis]